MFHGNKLAVGPENSEPICGNFARGAFETEAMPCTEFCDKQERKTSSGAHRRNYGIDGKGGEVAPPSFAAGKEAFFADSGLVVVITSTGFEGAAARGPMPG